MFNNIQGLYSIIYSRDSQKNPTYINDLINTDLIPIGIVLRDQNVTIKGEEKTEGILPCIVYKKLYEA